MEVFVLYMLTRGDAFISMFNGLVVLFLSISIIGTLVKFVLQNSGNTEEREASKRIKLSPFYVAFFFCAFMSAVIPTKSDMAIIVGGTLAVKAAQSETANKVVTVVNQMLDEELRKLAKTVKE